MTDTNIPTSVVLDRAADLIEERGWTKGTGWALLGKRSDIPCLEGAIQAAAEMPAVVAPMAGQLSYEINQCPAGRAVKAYLEDRHDPNSSLFCWNDAPGRTAAEVIEVLRAAAVIEAAKERADVSEVVAR